MIIQTFLQYMHNICRWGQKNNSLNSIVFFAHLQILVHALIINALQFDQFLKKSHLIVHLQ